MHVSKSFDEPDKHVVSLTLVATFPPKRGERSGQIGINRVTLDQDTVDKIEIADEGAEYRRYAKMGLCPFVVLAEIFSAAR